MSILEATGSHSHDDQTDREASNRAARTGNHAWDSRYDEDRMADQSNPDGDHDGAETTPVLVCHVGTEQRHDIRPELVDYLPVRKPVSFELL